MSSHDFKSHSLQMIRDALDNYAEQMEIDLKNNSFAEDISKRSRYLTCNVHTARNLTWVLVVMCWLLAR
jgi:hypothetical protein